MPARRVDIDVQEIVRRYQNGESSGKIGKAFNVSANTVLNRLREAGITIRGEKKEDRHIYMFTSAGWKHLETGEVVEQSGIPLDTTDIQALKALYIQA